MRSRHPHDSPSTAETKAALRARLRFRRAAHVATLNPVARRFAFAAPPDALWSLIPEAAVVALFAPVGDEPPVTGLEAALRSRGHAIALPRGAERASEPAFAQHEAGAILERGPFGVLQPGASAPPVRPDVIICPLLGFDRAGGRLGQGGGWYDRAGADHPSAPLIGLAWAVQEVDHVPTEPHDRRLAAIITETAFITVTSQEG